MGGGEVIHTHLVSLCTAGTMERLQQLLYTVRQPQTFQSSASLFKTEKTVTLNEGVFWTLRLEAGRSVPPYTLVAGRHPPPLWL